MQLKRLKDSGRFLLPLLALAGVALFKNFAAKTNAPPAGTAALTIKTESPPERGPKIFGDEMIEEIQQFHPQKDMMFHKDRASLEAVPREAVDSLWPERLNGLVENPALGRENAVIKKLSVSRGNLFEITVAGLEQEDAAAYAASLETCGLRLARGSDESADGAPCWQSYHSADVRVALCYHSGVLRLRVEPLR